MNLQPGDFAPDFTVNDQNGNPVSLKDFKGKKLALYFYPKDDTPTCTAQACNLRDHIGLLKENGILVVGVSVDDEEKHRKFEEKYSLPFPLLADTGHKMVNDYGVWREKSMFGKRYMGIERTSFLIDEEGKIAHIISKVQAKNHAEQILKLWK